VDKVEESLIYSHRYSFKFLFDIDTILKIQQLQASSITNGRYKLFPFLSTIFYKYLYICYCCVVVRPQASHSSTGGSISTSGDIKQLTSSIRKDQRG
jgi:hypothetical protein